MAKSKRPARSGGKQRGNAGSIIKTTSRSTASGPARKAGREAISDLPSLKLTGTQDLAAAFPFNAAKPSEYGDAAAAPARGQSTEPPHPAVGSSTLSETNASVKIGKG